MAKRWLRISPEFIEDLMAYSKDPSWGVAFKPNVIILSTTKAVTKRKFRSTSNTTLLMPPGRSNGALQTWKTCLKEKFSAI